MTAPETEVSSPWMPNGGGLGQRSSSARDIWTPGADCMSFWGNV
jgi:hypothetical protein